MILLLDNFDSYTYNLLHAIGQFGVACDVVRNDKPLSYFENLDFEGVVLSPGPEVPSRAGCLMPFIEKYAPDRPMLGVCLGHQAIGQYVGLQLVKAPQPRHGKLATIEVDQSSQLFTGLPEKFDVVQYNSLIVEGENPLINVTARTLDGQIMALEHRELPLAGVQFHPEAALSQYGSEIIKNWLMQHGLIN